MNTRHLARIAVVGSVLLAATSPAFADGRVAWEKMPRAAFHGAYHDYCAPVAVAVARQAAAPTADQEAIINDLLIGTYGGDCRDFYIEEIMPRADVPTQQGLIVVDR